MESTNSCQRRGVAAHVALTFAYLWGSVSFSMLFKQATQKDQMSGLSRTFFLNQSYPSPSKLLDQFEVPSMSPSEVGPKENVLRQHMVGPKMPAEVVWK